MSTRPNILLINPCIYDFTAYDFWLRPLGLLYIAGVLKKYARVNLRFIDCLDRHHPLLPKTLKTAPDGRGPLFKQEVEKPEVLGDIPRRYSRYGIPVEVFRAELRKAGRPDLVLLTCTMTYWYPGVRAVVEILQETWGNVPVLLGGVYPTLLPEHALSATGVDAVCRGPGEKKILSLVREFLGDRVCTPVEINTLAEMPFPAFDMMRDTEVLPILTSRGCPYTCKYCASPLLYRGCDQRSPDSVLAEIEHDRKMYRPRHVAFYDDALLFKKEKHIIPILESIAGRWPSIRFHTPNGLHVRSIDLKLARLLRRAGFSSLFLSQESFKKEWLDASGSKVSPGDLKRAIRHLKRAGFSGDEIFVYLMVGLPGQDFAEVKQDILRVWKLGVRPKLALFSPIPGTPQWEMMVADGIIPRDADPLLHNKALFSYRGGSLSPEDLEELKRLTLQPKNARTSL